MKRLLIAAAALLGTAAPAHASYASPGAFQAAFNSVNWGNGTRVTISHVGNCRAWVHSDFPEWWHNNGNVFRGGYSCRSGWITVRNPQGTRVCGLREASWNGTSAQWTYTAQNNCRWQ